MSGFEGFAAAIGVAELTLRSISRVYEFAKDIKDAPEQIARIRSELRQLNSYLSTLASLAVEGSPARPVIQRLDLSESVEKCGTTCSQLEQNLRKWTEGGPETASSRLRVRMNKANIESAIKDISSTTEKLHLGVSIATLQLQTDMSGKSPTQLSDQTRSRLPDSLLLSSTDSDNIHGSMVHQPRTAPSNSGPTQSRSQRMAEGEVEPDPSEATLSDGSAENGPEDMMGPIITEVHDTDDHTANDNEVTDSADTRIGAPSSVKIRNFCSTGNKVTGSRNTNIGRW